MRCVVPCLISSSRLSNYEQPNVYAVARFSWANSIFNQELAALQIVVAQFSRPRMGAFLGVTPRFTKEVPQLGGRECLTTFDHCSSGEPTVAILNRW